MSRKRKHRNRAPRDMSDDAATYQRSARRLSGPDLTAGGRPSSPTRRIQIIQLVVAVIGVAGTLALGTWFQNRRSEEALARSRANISLQGGIQPTHWLGDAAARFPARWDGWFFVLNSGPATAKQFIINIQTAAP